eukprot:ANDGO_07020.mRNA.1 CMP-sialic acid transporter 2
MRLLQAGSVIWLVTTSVFNVLICKFALAEDGNYSFIVPTVLVFSELLKCFFAVAFFVYDSGGFMQARNVARESLSTFIVQSLAGLAAMYVVYNNLLMYLFERVDPVTILLFRSGSILFTALMLWRFLKQPITKSQWFSLVFLAFSLVFSQYNPSSGTFRFGVLSYLICFFMDLCSASASTFNEWIIKEKAQAPLFLQNAILYGVGAFLNLLFVLTVFWSRISAGGYFEGYSGIVFPLILIQSCDGIAVSVVLKYANNVFKGIAASITVVVVLVLSNVIYGTSLSFIQVLGCIQCLLASLMYVLESVSNNNSAESATVPRYLPLPDEQDWLHS